MLIISIPTATYFVVLIFSFNNIFEKIGTNAQYEHIINGENKIEVRVTTTLGNYMKSLPDENRVAYVYVNNKRRMQDFQSQGMIGPVRIFY